MVFILEIMLSLNYKINIVGIIYKYIIFIK